MVYRDSSGANRFVSGQILTTAFQKPSAPSPIARLGAILRPRCIKSVNTSSQLAADDLRKNGYLMLGITGGDGEVMDHGLLLCSTVKLKDAVQSG